MGVPSFGVDFTRWLNGLVLLFTMLVLGWVPWVMSYAPEYLSPDHDQGRLYGIHNSIECTAAVAGPLKDTG